MKKVKLIIALFTVTAFIFSCNPKDKEPDTVKAEKVSLASLITAKEMQILDSVINIGNESALARGGKRNKPPKNVTVAPVTTMTLTNNTGSFTIDYGGATNYVNMFFRGGDTLYANGNVIPQNSQAFYLTQVTTFTTWVSGYANYQSVVVTGSITPDENGVVGADWVFTYTNVVH